MCGKYRESLSMTTRMMMMMMTGMPPRPKQSWKGNNIGVRRVCGSVIEKQREYTEKNNDGN